ncbi:uncharacterized protein [Halyomorpha halys]|uniref:uncharacterized protein isoform X1 n=1 Tax=Halyomorpha halys TaxID=286706 RepID=UPI0006D4ED9A|nr:uncharacterized protein LOC106684173 isoform X1 [Halyomorpha halys]
MSERQVLCGAPGSRNSRMRLKICCIKLSLAARIIAMVGLIASVLVLTQLSTELAEPDANGGGTVSILLGLDVDDFWQSSSNNGMQGLEVLIAFLLFSFVYATASAILIWGSIVEVSCFAYPWLLCEAISFVTQIITIYLHSLKSFQRTNRWILLLSAFNLVISIYFWVVVFCAARSWAKQKREERENASTSTLSSGNETINDENYTTQLPQKGVQV